MRKKVFGHKFSRNTNSRQALFRSLIVSVIQNGKIETTKIKAKAVQADIDKIMTFVGQGDLAARRLVLSRLANDKETTEKLFKDFKKLTEKRKSGFTRITVLPNRKGDNAPMARLEFMEEIKNG